MSTHSLRKTLLFLILSFILIFGVTYHLEKALAIDEVVDNYTDETKVAGKHQVVRNTTFNAMELEIGNDTVLNDPMDIWTTGGFTEIDPGGDNLKNINDTQIWFDNVDRDEGDRIYKDFGANYFDVSFRYHFRVKISSFHQDNARCYFMLFSEDNDDVTGTIANSHDYLGFLIQWLIVGSEWKLFLIMRDSDAPAQLTDSVVESGPLDLDKWYYVKYIRDGDNVTGWFYNDALMTNLDFMLTVSLSNVDNIRYFHPLNSQDQATGDRAMDMWLNRVRNYTIELGYFDEGHFYTNDILDGIAYTAQALLVNSTIPADDSITVEFSQDNSTWTLNDWEPIFGGYEAIDLRELGYSTMYCRFNFTDGGADSTPRLYQVRLIHSAPGPDSACIPHIFNASSIAVINGTLNDGDINSTYFVDGDWYNVSEIVGPPGLDVRFNFTGLQPSCGCLEIYHTYTGKSPHHLEIQVWNFTSTSWNQIGTIIYNETLGWECSGLGGSPLHFFSDGKLWARVYHEDRGHVPHELQVDRIALRLTYAEVCPTVNGVTEPDYVPYIALGIILLLFGLIIGQRLRK